MLDTIIEDKSLTEPELKAEAMYWRGDTYLRKIEAMEGRGDPTDAAEAYRTFKRLTWDYPETKWAKYARGRLAQEESLQNAAENS